MDQSVIAAVMPAITGFIAGTIGSLIAPWVSWGIEKKRMLREGRKTLLKDARDHVSSNLFGPTFVSKAIYRRLKPDFRPEMIEVIENYDRFQDQSDDPGEFPRSFREAVLDEISRLEREWGLL
jgi:hypothetical protein